MLSIRLLVMMVLLFIRLVFFMVFMVKLARLYLFGGYMLGILVVLLLISV